MTFVFDFDHAHDTAPMLLKALLGGKGANLAEMTSVLELPVPPGFTITTEACRSYLRGSWPHGLDEELSEHCDRLERVTGKRIGHATDPLLVSVRSGSQFSMPGMMDSILDLGLNDESAEGLAEQTDERFAYDCYRRFIATYGRIVLGIAAPEFDQLLAKAKESDGASADGDLSAPILRQLCRDSQDVVQRRTGDAFPQDPLDQLRGAIEAVFRSWNGARAIAYRTREQISHDIGTAVNVQAMVFGNRDESSGTGVGFTRNPSTGERVAYGDFLANAQGEDVVAGIRNTESLAAFASGFPDLYAELTAVFDRLEAHYRDMCDVEFTVEQGRLWILQTRVGQRTGVAALRMAVAMTQQQDWTITKAEALCRLTADQLAAACEQRTQASSAGEVLATGLPASPGVAVGRVYFTADDVLAAVDRGEPAILVREETSPEDVEGMAEAEGILTSRGGLVSHAAVVARGWGKPAVCGAAAVIIRDKAFRVGDVVVSEGDLISLDGSTGEVFVAAAEVSTGDLPPEFSIVLEWADEFRHGSEGVRGMKVHADVDNAFDARQARERGADGVVLTHADRALFDEERLPLVHRLIEAESPEEEDVAINTLQVARKIELLEVFEALDGLPVTVLLDPALPASPPVAELADVKPRLYDTQVKALMGAVRERLATGARVAVEVMIPTGHLPQDVTQTRARVEDVEVAGGLDVSVGALIHVPRDALDAAAFADHVDFFVLDIATNANSSSDAVRVREHLRLAVERVRSVKPQMEVGVWADEGNDPDSIRFFYDAGLDYVVCGLEQIPIARLGAAQAVIGASASATLLDTTNDSRRSRAPAR